MSETETGETLAENAGNETSTSVSTAGGRFAKGHDPRRNLAGRIKKAPTVLDETQKLAERAKNRRKIAQAWVATMATPHTAVGQRARADYRDTFHGVPKQTLVLDAGELPPGMGWLQRLSGETVDGESRVLPADEDTGDST